MKAAKTKKAKAAFRAIKYREKVKRLWLKWNKNSLYGKFGETKEKYNVSF